MNKLTSLLLSLDDAQEFRENGSYIGFSSNKDPIQEVKWTKTKPHLFCLIQKVRI